MAAVSHLFVEVTSLADLGADLLRSLAAFWKNYNTLRGVGFKALAVRDGAAAAQMIGR